MLYCYFILYLPKMKKLAILEKLFDSIFITAIVQILGYLPWLFIFFHTSKDSKPRIFGYHLTLEIVY